MVIYMVDRIVPNFKMDQWVDSQRSAIETSLRFKARGEPVRCLRTTYVPGESRCMFWFEAPNSRTIEEVFEVAEVVFDRIIEVIESIPEE